MARPWRPARAAEANETDRLRLSEARYRTLFEHAPEALVVLDADAGRFVEVNAQAEALFGLDRGALSQHNPGTLSPPKQPDGSSSIERARAYVERALEGETPRFEWTHRDARGHDVLCEVRLVRMPAKGQRLVRGSITDIRERRRLEEEIHQSRKMEAIGKLAGGIAHDFNNLLTVIHSSARLGLLEVDPRSEVADHLRRICKSGETASSLTERLLAFGRRQVIQPRVLDINRLVRDLVGMLRRVIGEDIDLKMSFDPALRPVEIDPSQLEQVVVNLVVNARDAMPRGGALSIATRNAEADPGAGGGAGPYTVLRVADTGAGIPGEIQPQIFEPFFTTKPDLGTGLGLSTVYGIVEQNGGHIRLESEEGQGASFEIWVPSASAPVADDEIATEEAGRGNETILLVEDDTVVRELLVDSLRGYGYRVLETNDSASALIAVQQASAPIDLVVSDVVMPGMTGHELSERIAASRPDTSVLLISGYAHDLIPRGAPGPGVSFLSKPFTPDVLARTVRGLLDDRRSATA